MSYIAQENLYLTEAKPGELQEILRGEERIEERRYLLAAAGARVPEDLAVKYGLVHAETQQPIGTVPVMGGSPNAMADENSRLKKQLAQNDIDMEVLLGQHEDELKKKDAEIERLNGELETARKAAANASKGSSSTPTSSTAPKEGETPSTGSKDASSTSPTNPNPFSSGS